MYLNQKLPIFSLLLLSLSTIGFSQDSIKNQKAVDLNSRVDVIAETRFDKLGFSVAGIGDFNGDGIDDFASGAPGDTDDLNTPGEVYVVFGSENISNQILRTDLDGNAGFVIRGLNSREGFGYAVQGGDYNGDGLSDLAVVEAYGSIPPPSIFDQGNQAGRVWIIFGTDQTINGGIFDLSSLLQENGGNGSKGFIVEGSIGDNRVGLGGVVTADMNADGRDDLVIGVPGGPGPNDNETIPGFARLCGETLIVFGKQQGQNFPPKITNANIQQQGSVIYGADSFDGMGSSISSGDFNGDGTIDIAILSPGGAGRTDANGLTGEILMLFARPNFPSVEDLRDYESGTNQNGFMIYGTPGEITLAVGTRIFNAGDIDGNGFDDLVIGELRPPKNAILFYRNGSQSTSIDVTNISPTQGAEINDRPNAGITNVGFSASTAGDYNNDGFDDLAIGAPGAFGVSGEVYIFNGSPVRLSGDITGADADLLIPGEGEFGTSIANAGDVNNDGIDDIIIGADNADGANIMQSAFGRAILYVGQEKVVEPGPPTLWLLN